MNLGPYDARAPVPGLGSASAPSLPPRHTISTPSLPPRHPSSTPTASPQPSVPALPPRPGAPRLPYSPSSQQGLLRSPGYGYGSMGQPSYGYGRGYTGGYGATGGYGGVGGYGGAGGFGGVGGYGQPGDGLENRFIQLAEESSLPAFQTIGSVVQTFGSISMMLESSFHAIQSSFQAVLQVAEQFTKMKLHISQVFSAIAAIRFIKYLYAKLLYLFGLATSNPALAESAWRSANPGGGLGGLTEGDLRPAVRWPTLMYLGLVFAAPYLLWKVLSSLLPSQAGGGAWARGEGEHYVARALHPFTAGGEGEVALEQGETLRLAPKHLQPRVRGWLLASSGSGTGLVPANYLEVLGRREGRPPPPRPDLVSHEPPAEDGGLVDDFLTS